eukprot:TRINITY_DN2143_c0_g1_i3.p1 TRINITY_DN2143_c0_g1~~TRINITY_DN2143_c0_g1_i3.p1  ORF type:complete len:282 (-),score=83.34 TRINITY_DN2143_c0_g1_i3:166-1011(-)
MYPPFVLKLVDRKGHACSRCPWIKACLGCALEVSDEVLVLGRDECVAIDWTSSYAQQYLNIAEANSVWEHDTVQQHAALLARPISFADCMACFTQEEILDGDSAAYCSRCKKMERAVKKLELWSTPPILIIHLKRLLPQGVKLTTLVDFPLHAFDPSPFLSDDNMKRSCPLYDLYAVVNHMGPGSNGHYVTSAFNRHTQQWYLYDDDRVTPIPPNKVISNSCYMLFYRRRGLYEESVLSLLPPAVREAVNSSDLTPDQKRLLAAQGESSAYAQICPQCALL